MSDDRIDIAGLDKAEVLAALYNRARPLGMGYHWYDPTPLNAEQAQALFFEEYGVTTPAFSVDYLRGRVMKVNLTGDTFDPWLYDRDNGEGAAAAVIAAMRNGES